MQTDPGWGSDELLADVSVEGHLRAAALALLARCGALDVAESLGLA